MLYSAEHRPANVDPIYELDVDIPTVTAQVRTFSTKIAAAVDAANLTLSRRSPTQSLLAALVFDISELTLSLVEVQGFCSDISRSFRAESELVVSGGQAKLYVSLEQYEPSAFSKQISHTVADLPV